MALPTNFNSWEHFQSTYQQVHNKIVREEFSDTGENDGISTPRSSLKEACLSADNDTAMQLVARAFFFWFDVRKARDLMPPVFAIPDGSDQIRLSENPKVVLYFQEDFGQVEPGYAPITGQISFRLMDKTNLTITEANLQTLANKIKSEFALNNGYVWKKGKDYYSYRNYGQGYRLQILAYSETVAINLINKVLDIQGHTIDSERLFHSENKNPVTAYPTIPGNQTILGKSRKKKRQRPVADVRFQYAMIEVQGIPNPIPLVDCSGTLRNALEKTY